MSFPLKHSKQRTAILNDLRSRYDHPTAEMVHTRLKEEFPNLSLGTVYRNLGLLCELGEIIKVGSDENGKEHYDGHVHPHAHFFCEECKTISDLETNLNIDQLEHQLGAKIYQISSTIRGICRDCLNKI